MIFGAGPAGLAAGWVLARRGDAPVVLERSDVVGGISRTVEWKGYRFDIGGHRFFTRFDEVQALWEEVLGEAFLVRPRLSRIYYAGRFYDYPLKARNALMNLGPVESARCLASYARVRVRPHADESSFDGWVRNRFGDRLFDIFFKSYTEKVWGIPTTEIGAEWASQRIKNLDLGKAVKRALRFSPGDTSVVSLVEHFHYPRTGPGLMYESMARQMTEAGGELRFRSGVVRVEREGLRVVRAWAGAKEAPVAVEGDAFLSSMPLTLLIRAMDPPAPPEVITSANALKFRNLLCVNLVVDHPTLFPDNWIYVHDKRLRLGRIQNFKNWSPAMVPDPRHTTLGLEYFCSDDDDLWRMDDEKLVALGTSEIAQAGLLGAARVLDGMVVRAPKAYPVYERGYEAHLATVVAWLRRFENLQPVGRYGMFKYNNADHSILTALLAVENLDGATHDIWATNTDSDYHEIRPNRPPRTPGHGSPKSESGTLPEAPLLENDL